VVLVRHRIIEWVALSQPAQPTLNVRVRQLTVDDPVCEAGIESESLGDRVRQQIGGGHLRAHRAAEASTKHECVSHGHQACQSPAARSESRHAALDDAFHHRQRDRRCHQVSVSGNAMTATTDA